MGDKAHLSQIPRGADLTEDDLAIIAHDAFVVSIWCMNNRLKRADWQDQIRKAVRARLGRQPLVIAEPVAREKHHTGAAQ